MINSNNLHIKVLLVTGGSDGSYLDTTEVFDSSVGSWTAGASLPRSMAFLSATYMEDKVLIFGEGHFIPDTNIITLSNYFQVAMTVVIITTPFCSTTALETSSQRWTPCWSRGIATPSAWSSTPTSPRGASNSVLG